ncbi:hypothetical protein B0H66DRAFT_566610 [Apodospora peruviana]|uniref:Uncharacterized protein n=1 Tax=Apodospora peruviana TaxID=516989 RepID=A0AAE0HVE9_9PEZI|nr:hypothetical protein B0H66DRAFT_566610 [Apodospora peruviana]
MDPSLLVFVALFHMDPSLLVFVALFHMHLSRLVFVALCRTRRLYDHDHRRGDRSPPLSAIQGGRGRTALMVREAI